MTSQRQTSWQKIKCCYSTTTNGKQDLYNCATVTNNPLTVNVAAIYIIFPTHASIIVNDDVKGCHVGL